MFANYVAEETEARSGQRGIWQGKFVPPWEYRSKRWEVARQTAPDGCVIKGNINRKGVRIYHAPWSKSYDRTQINTSKGERWFCSEREAIDAGWRAPYN